MGIATAIILGVSAAVSIAGTVSAANAQIDAADAQGEELTRQQEETNLISQEQRSDRARQASKDFASMTVAMAESGGAAGQNEQRFGGEIQYLNGLDLARIEGNRRNQVAALQADKRSVRAGGAAARTSAGFGIVSGTLDILGSGSTLVSQSQAQKAAEDLAKGEVT